jgi:hypothetical protein
MDPGIVAFGAIFEERTKRSDGGDTDAMSDLWDETEDGDVSPICTACGVSALPPESPGESSMCENPNCSAFGELISTRGRGGLGRTVDRRGD